MEDPQAGDREWFAAFHDRSAAEALAQISEPTARAPALNSREALADMAEERRAVP
jgi:hypothetical protein